MGIKTCVSIEYKIKSDVEGQHESSPLLILWISCGRSKLLSRATEAKRRRLEDVCNGTTVAYEVQTKTDFQIPGRFVLSAFGW